MIGLFRTRGFGRDQRDAPAVKYLHFPGVNRDRNDCSPTGMRSNANGSPLHLLGNVSECVAASLSTFDLVSRLGLAGFQTSDGPTKVLQVSLSLVLKYLRRFNIWPGSCLSHGQGEKQ